MGKLPVGLQVYSVRDDAGKDFLGTMKKIKEIGYDFVELAGLYGQTAEEVKAALEEAGIPALSAHVPLAELEADVEKIVADYVKIGCKYIAIPYLPEELRPNTPGFDKVMSLIPQIGEVCNKHGVTLLYHNHDFEFVKVADGRYALDYMYETIPAELLQTELDCCWVKVAGEEPAGYIKKYENRCPVVHLKDFYKEGNPENLYELIGIDPEEKKEDSGKFEFRPVGFGIQVMPEILEAAVANGAEYVVVEQDASVGRTPMEAVTMSKKYLDLLGF
ncbi:sugar phosphate isomerase/epimerase family protein [Massiliimalia timonensis]|uniref:sugar phosphate isomerase/epimerase family protein n=1 Tax=Massiliimalia timonensis TaxID=1987501 RepID=UPI00189F748E|nr:sugar phosphate isomerase/epimerase [Massiliimalia timonensis]